MNNFCTLFDSAYLSRAVAMHGSLLATGEEFTLHALCLDEGSFRAVESLRLPGVVPLRHEEFAPPELRAVESRRTRREYCWTCTPFLIGHCLEQFGLDEVTYLDADLFFFNGPSLLLREFRSARASVLLTPHHYTPRYDQTATAGRYCVQFMTFTRDARARAALDWWRDQCLAWCHARFEDGKFGDQKYLDDWTVRFHGVHVLEHRGGGVAPWNVQQYRIGSAQSQVTVDGEPLVFFHFHGYRWHEDGVHDLGSYYLGKAVIDAIYRPYMRALVAVQEQLRAHGLPPGHSPRSSGWATRARGLKRWLTGCTNRLKAPAA